MLGFTLCFFKNIFMRSNYFGKFLAKKKKKEASWSYLSIQIVKTNAHRYIGNFLMFWHWFVF